MRPIKEPCRVSYTIDARQYLSWQRRPRPACLRRAAIPRPVTASGPPAHRCTGARRTLVASTDSSFGLVSGRSSLPSPPSADGRRHEHGRMLPEGSHSHLSAKPQLSWLGRSGPSERKRASHRAYCIPPQTATSTMRSMVRGAGRAASPQRAERVKGCVFVCSINKKEQRGDVKRERAGADLSVVAPARSSKHDRASLSYANRWRKIAGPLRMLRTASPCSHPLRGPAHHL
ncbi:MAG: hypothetical protein A4E35_01253 [Methanoregula sp. PtaU1.Bin051]|nr:MAG: hypothetical protein A4E35_01253 [Methanoregula sp. PtaU1.Bin051]